MPGSAEVLIYDEISPWGVSATQVAMAIREQEPFDELNVLVNSPGGFVFEAQAIYTNLARVRKSVTVNCRIDGLCASAATFVVAAADKITMAENAAMMIHKPWSIAIGDAEDLRAEATVLDALEETMVKQYEALTGLDAATIRQMLADETWMNADEALEFGFISEIEETMPIAACIGMSQYFSNPRKWHGHADAGKRVDIEMPERIKKRLTLTDRDAEMRALVAKQVAS